MRHDARRRDTRPTTRDLHISTGKTLKRVCRSLSIGVEINIVFVNSSRKEQEMFCFMSNKYVKKCIIDSILSDYRNPRFFLTERVSGMSTIVL